MSDPLRALRPTSGARFLLERTATSSLHPGPGDAGADGARAAYRTAIYTPDAEFTGTATLVDDGTVEVAATGAPSELDDMLTMLAKLTARGAAKRREDGLPAWPARLLRWRGPRGAGRG